MTESSAFHDLFVAPHPPHALNRPAAKRVLPRFRLPSASPLRETGPTSAMNSTEFNRPELPALGIVRHLDDDDRRLLSNYGEFLPLAEGAIVVKEGDPQNSLIFLISGLLHVTTRKDERTALLARIEPGEAIGEVSIFDPGTASATVQAKQFSQIWKTRRDDLDAFLAAYPEAAGRLLIGLLSDMARRLRRMNDKLSNTELQGALQEYFR